MNSLEQLAARAPWVILGAVGAAVILDLVFDAERRRWERERRLDALEFAIDDLERRASEAGA